MSNRLFGVNNPVTHCAPKRRTWGGTVLTVLILLALAALCVWLWSCVREAAGQTWRVGDLASGRLMAMAPATQGALMGLLAFVSVLAIFLAVRKVRSDEEFFARLHASNTWRPDDLAHEEFERHAQQQRAVRIGLQDLREIVNACRAESRVALLFVEAALTTTDMDDYADALRAAHEKLAQVTKTLGELQRSLNHGPAKAGTTNAEGAKA